MTTPSTCLSLRNLDEARKAYDKKLAEVRAIDRGDVVTTQITAARFMLNEALAERSAIVSDIVSQAKSNGLMVNLENIAHEVTGIAM